MKDAHVDAITLLISDVKVAPKASCMYKAALYWCTAEEDTEYKQMLPLALAEKLGIVRKPYVPA